MGAVVEAVSVDFAVVLPGVIGLQLTTVSGRNGRGDCPPQEIPESNAFAPTSRLVLPFGIAFIIAVVLLEVCALETATSLVL